MINAFSSRSNLSTLNLHLKISFSPKGFNSQQISKDVSSSVSFMLTLTWGIDVLFEKLTPETGE